MYYTNHTVVKNITKPSYSVIPYNQSEIDALVAGYSEVADERAFNRRYFIKDGKKWIHNLESLRKKLNAEYGYYICDEELSAKDPEGFGYDVENYYFRHQGKNLSQKGEFKNLMGKVRMN